MRDVNSSGEQVPSRAGDGQQEREGRGAREADAEPQSQRSPSVNNSDEYTPDTDQVVTAEQVHAWMQQWPEVEEDEEQYT